MVKESQETRVAKGSLVFCINTGRVEMKRDFFLAHMLKRLQGELFMFIIKWTKISLEEELYKNQYVYVDC